MTFALSSTSHAPSGDVYSSPHGPADSGAPTENSPTDSGNTPCKDEGKGDDTGLPTSPEVFSPPSDTPGMSPDGPDAQDEGPYGHGGNTTSADCPDVSSGGPDGQNDTLQSPKGLDAPKPDAQGDDYVSPSTPRGQSEKTPPDAQPSGPQPGVTSPTYHAPSEESPSQVPASGEEYVSPVSVLLAREGFLVVYRG